MKKMINAVFRQGLPARDLRNANIVNLWAFAWAATMILASLGMKYGWYTSAYQIIIAFAVHVSIGIGLILAYRRFLTRLDELERKIQLNALALSVGVAMVGGSGHSLLAKAGFVSSLGFHDMLALIALTYMVSLIVGRIRYA